MANTKISALSSMPAFDTSADVLVIVDTSTGTTHKVTIDSLTENLGEDGTSDMAFSSAGGSITINSSINSLAYTKIGRKVTITGGLDVSSVSSPTGALTITGLPFTSASASELSISSGFGIMYTGLTVGSTNGLVGRVVANSTTIEIYDQTTTGVTDAAAKIQAGSTLYFNFSYFTS